MRGIDQNNVGAVNAHTGLTHHIGQYRRGDRMVHHQNIAVVMQLHLPAQQRLARSAVEGRRGKLDHQHRIAGVDKVLLQHTATVGTGVEHVAVASQEVDLGIVDNGIRHTERRRKVASACQSAAQAQITVGVDRKLGIVARGKRERKTDILQGRSLAVRARVGRREDSVGRR